MARCVKLGNHRTLFHVLSLLVFGLAAHVQTFSWHTAFRRVASPASRSRGYNSDFSRSPDSAFRWRSRRRSVMDPLESLPDVLRGHELPAKERIESTEGFYLPEIPNHIPQMPQPRFHLFSHRGNSHRRAGWDFMRPLNQLQSRPPPPMTTLPSHRSPHYVSFHYATPVLKAGSMNRRTGGAGAGLYSSRRDEEVVNNVINEVLHNQIPTLRFGPPIVVPASSSPADLESKMLPLKSLPKPPIHIPRQKDAAVSSSRTIATSATSNVKPTSPARPAHRGKVHKGIKQFSASSRSSPSFRVESPIHFPAAESLPGFQDQSGFGESGFSSFSGPVSQPKFASASSSSGFGHSGSFGAPTGEVSASKFSSSSGFGELGSFGAPVPARDISASKFSSSSGFGEPLSFGPQPVGSYSGNNKKTPSSSFHSHSSGGFGDFAGAADTDVGSFGWKEPSGPARAGFSAGFEPIPTVVSEGGSFVADDKDCDTILTKSCTSDSECVCYGFYYCSEGRCKDSTSSSSNTGAVTFGDEWHDGPAETLGLSGRRR